MDYETITIGLAPGTEADQGIRVLTLNRPDVMNAMNTRMFIELREAVRGLAADDGLRVLIVTGAGTRAFSAGGDLKERNGMSDKTWRAQHQIIEEGFLAVKDFPVPVIAAVEGHAHGGGFELALMADFLVGSRTALFSLAEVKRGIMPGGGGIQNLVRAAGMRRARQLLFTGDSFDAEQAFAWDILNELVETRTGAGRGHGHCAPDRRLCADVGALCQAGGQPRRRGGFPHRLHAGPRRLQRAGLLARPARRRAGVQRKAPAALGQPLTRPACFRNPLDNHNTGDSLMKRSTFLRSLVALGLPMPALRALAQAASGRPVRLIVPLPAGTATDMAARVLAQHLSTMLGQTFVVDNKPGANGTIGVADLVRSAPDGHTLLIGSQSPLATNVALVKNLNYDPQRDFSPINGFGITMHVLMVKPTSPARTLPEFIALAKQRAGQLNVGTTTTTTLLQVATLNKLAGIQVMPVPYKGIPATITDVIGGNLDATLVDLGNAIAQAKGGTLRPLAVTSINRNPLVPDWPAMAETLPGYDFPSWVGMVGPAGMPADMVDRLNAAVGKVLQTADIKERLATIGMTPMPMTPEQMKTFIGTEVTKWVRLAREANVQPE